MILIVENVKLLSEDIIDQEGWIEGSHTGDNRHFKDEYEDYLNYLVELLFEKPILLQFIHYYNSDLWKWFDLQASVCLLELVLLREALKRYVERSSKYKSS